MRTATPPRGRPWRLAALAASAVLVTGPFLMARNASAESAPATTADSSPAPVLTCRTPLGSPLPTPSAVAALAAPAVPGAPAAPAVPRALAAPAAGAVAAEPDTTPPSAPGDLTAVLTGPTSATVTWSPATDNVGVTGYEVWGSVYYEVPGWATICATTRIATVASTVTSVDLELTAPANPNVTVVRYTFFTKAFDAAGNVSAQSGLARITVPSTTPSQPGTTGPATCLVAYTPQGQWTGGFQAMVRITNSGATAVNGWRLTFTFPGDQQVLSAWNASVTQSGAVLTAANVNWNGLIAPGASVSFGMQGTWSRSNDAPTSFAVNGIGCANG